MTEEELQAYIKSICDPQALRALRRLLDKLEQSDQLPEQRPSENTEK